MLSRLLSQSLVHSALDWFMPHTLTEDRYVAQRVRMFLISHLFGPVLGHSITVYLYFIDPSRGSHLWVLAASITLFWAFPWALKLFGRHFDTLALLSVQNLTFATLWGSYHYGGVSSPFLMWLLIVPLLAFFYLGSGWFARISVFTLMGVNVSGFYLVYLLGHGFPEHVPLSEMVGMGVVSAGCASIYVFMMAIYYTNIVDSQSELEKEVQRHRVTMVELVDAKEEAERANGAKSEFLAKMSHELRTPLNAVIGYSEILLEDAELEGRGEEIADLQKINNAGKHLLALVTDVLDLSKIEAGMMELVTEEIDLVRFIDEVASTCRPMVAKNTNDLVVECDSSIGVLEGDPTKLRQAVLNLLGNASKFTENGRVTLKAERQTAADGDWIRISVRDTGIGISEDDRAKLFENFSQARPTISAKYGGTGLGLSLSRKLCRLMGGDISVESELGRGACFTIRLPAARTDAARAASERGVDGRLPAPAPQLPFPREAPTSGRKIVLVIDDDHSVLELADRMLAKEGFHAVLADNAESGVRLARTIRPALILLDVLMPGMDGWQALRLLKEGGVASCPVVMLSVVDDRKTGLALGAAGYLVKPLERDALQRVLRQVESGHGGASVLVVAQEPTAAERAATALREEGWPVRVAADFDDALAEARRERPLLVAVGSETPSESVYDFLAELDRTLDPVGAPILALVGSGYGAAERQRLAALGVALAASSTPHAFCEDVRRLAAPRAAGVGADAA